MYLSIYLSIYLQVESLIHLSMYPSSRLSLPIDQYIT